MYRNLTDSGKKLLIDLVEAERRSVSQVETFALLTHEDGFHEPVEYTLSHSGLISELGTGMRSVKKRDLDTLTAYGYITFDHARKGYRITSLGFGYYEYIK